MSKKEAVIIVLVLIVTIFFLFRSLNNLRTENYETAKSNLETLKNMTPDELYQNKKLQLIREIEGYEKKL